MAAYERGGVLILLITANALLAAPVLAADIGDLSPEQLFSATVISASKTSEKLMDAPAAIYVLTNEDIARSGATSIPEALRLVPGVQVARVNADAWAVSVRGFNSSLANKLLVLIDGREIYDPLFSGVYWDVQDTVLEDIDRIEVIRGPGASLWGANAVNGVINIITKKTSETQGNLVSLTAGNEDRNITEMRHGGKFDDDGYYRAYAKYRDRNHFQTLTGADAHDGQTEERVGFRADWKGAPQNDFTFQGDAYNSDDGDLRSVPYFTVPFARTQTENISARGANMQGRWSRELADDSRFSLQSYLDYTSRSQIVVEDQRLSFNMDGQYEMPDWGQHKVIVGGGYRYSFDHLRGSTLASFTDDGESTSVFSGFIQDKITLEPKKWFLTIGTKLEHNDFTGFEVQPNARVQWHPDEQQTVWTSISRAVRTPSRLQHDLSINEGVLSLFGLPAELLLMPSPNFKSEELVAYEIGYRNQITPSLLIDTTAFFNDYSHLATLSFLTPNLGVVPFLFPLNFTNDTAGETYGFEGVVNWRALDNLNFSASYTALNINMKGPNGNAAIDSQGAAQQSADQQFNIRSQWDVTDNTSLDSTLYYVGAIPAYKVHEYWRFDMRWNWRVMDGLQFTLVGQNLLDGEHREFSSLTDANAINVGRSFYGNFTWRF